MTNGRAIITRGKDGFHIWYILPDDSQVMLAGAHPTVNQAESVCRKMKLFFIVREPVRRAS